MRKLQCIQNTLARIVTNCNKYTWASPILKRLHWLLVEFRCIFKAATLVYKFLHNGYPSYFGPLLSTRCGRYSTRYNHPDKRVLEVPQFCPSVHKSKKKKTLATALLLMLTRFRIICLMRSVLPQLSPVSGKKNCISSIRHSQLSIYSIRGLRGTGLGKSYGYMIFLIGFWCCALKSA